MLIRKNNFDLLRLIAALQVVIFHSIKHYEIVFSSTVVNFCLEVLKQFPGVPIFFTISGFLVYQSYEKNALTPIKYFRNRFLRLYPGLWVMILIMSAVILIECFISSRPIIWSQFFIWLACELTFFQFYTPEGLRFWGVGAPNGSLWTITTEIQFYCIVPIIFLLLKKSKHFILILFVLFVFVHMVISQQPEVMWEKLLWVSIFNYLYCFMAGIIFYVYSKRLSVLWEKNFLIWLVIYSVFAFKISVHLPADLASVLTIVLLSITVMSFAYTIPSLSNLLLKGTDISYGIYIYHMLVVNFFVHRGLINRLDVFIITFLIVIGLAYWSWIYIEKPLLRHKFKNKSDLSKTVTPSLSNI
jgi:peptidoglycan/LPS O-acetylase OafA/YrhL